MASRVPEEDRVMLTGAPGSPYTRKMLAYLRYRHIPYEFVVQGSPRLAGLPEPRVRLIPIFYLRDDDGTLRAVTDSTPLMRRFEAAFTGRHAVPRDPGLAFLDALIEDYADEWLTKAMFHYRWHYRPDIDRAAAVLPRWRRIDAPEPEMQAAGRHFAERQIGRLGYVGSNGTTAPVIEASYGRLLDLFDALLQRQPFVLGRRPGTADFALYGQLTQLTHFDPTPMALALERSPRLFAWVDLVEDLSGLAPEDGDWSSTDEALEVLGPLLREIGRVYLPYLVANARAVASGAREVAAEIDGKPWRQAPFPYQAKCLAALQRAWAALPDGTRTELGAHLDPAPLEITETR